MEAEIASLVPQQEEQTQEVVSEEEQEVIPQEEIQTPRISDKAGDEVTVRIAGENISGTVQVDEGGKTTIETPQGRIYELEPDTPFTEYTRPVNVSQEGDIEVNGESFTEARIVVEDGKPKALLIRGDGTTKAITNPRVVEEIEYQIALANMESMTDEDADNLYNQYEQQRETETVTEEGAVETDERTEDDRKLQEALEEIDLIEQLALEEIEQAETSAKLVEITPQGAKESKVYLVSKNQDGSYSATLNGRKVKRQEVVDQLGQAYETETKNLVGKLQDQVNQLKSEVEQNLFGKPVQEEAKAPVEETQQDEGKDETKVPEGKGSWRSSFNETNDVFRKNDILRAVVEVSKEPNELNDIYEAQKNISKKISTNNLLWDLVNNKNLPQKTFDEIIKSKELKSIATNDAIQSLIDKRKETPVQEETKPKQEDVKEKPKAKSPAPVKDNTGKKGKGIVAKVRTLYDKKKPLFVEIKGKFNYPKNATVAKIAKDYDDASAKPKAERTAKEQEFIDFVDNQMVRPFDKKESEKGKKPLDERKKRGKELKAQNVKPTTIQDVVEQWFIKGGRLSYKGLQQLFGQRKMLGRKSIEGEKRARMSYLRTPEKGGKNIFEIVEDITNNLSAQFQDVDQMTIRNAVEDAIKDNVSIAQMSKNVLERAGQVEDAREFTPIEDRAGVRQEDAIREMFTEEEWNEMSYEDKASALNDYYRIPSNSEYAYTPEMVQQFEEDRLNPTPEEIEYAVEIEDSMSQEEKDLMEQGNLELQELFDEEMEGFEEAFVPEVDETPVEQPSKFEEGKTKIAERPEMENPVYGVLINGEEKFLQRVEGNDFDQWYEVRKTKDGVWDMVEPFIGFNKKEAIEMLYSESKAEQPSQDAENKKIADRIRDKKINGALSSIDFGLTPNLYNKALDFMANQVEKGTKLGNAIANTIKWIDSQMSGKKWNKGAFGKYINDTYKVKLADGREVDVTRDDSKETADVINGWYQPIEQAILDTKQESLPANKWAERLKSKEDEDLWTGVREFLESKGTESVSKKELQDYIKENRVEVVEVVKGVDDLTPESKWSKRASGDGIWETKAIDGTKLIIDASQGDGEVYVYADGKEIDSDSYSNGDNPFDLGIQIIESMTDYQDSPTKFSEYQLEGEKENYKEVLVTLPSAVKQLPSNYKSEKTAWDTYQIKDEKGNVISESGGLAQATVNALDIINKQKKSISYIGGHFSEQNILVHLRMNTRTDSEGNKVLFLEEIQSDWGQKGKKKGFKNEVSVKSITELFEKTGKENHRYTYEVEFSNGIVEEVDYHDDVVYDKKPVPSKSEIEKTARLSLNVSDKGEIPTAPFVTDTNSWVKLGLKTAIKEAVNQGADKIAWTTGEQQNSRYNLSKQVDQLEVSNQGEGIGYKVVGMKGGETLMTKLATAQELPDIIGKELSQKIIDSKIPFQKTKIFSGVDLKLGGTGMKGFYDGIVPSVAKATIKELTGKEGVVVMTEFVDGSESFKERLKSKRNDIPISQPSIIITPELKASVKLGMPLFGKAESKTKIEQQKELIRQLEKEAWENAKRGGFDNMGISFDFKKAMEADKRFYDSVGRLIREYVRLKGMQASEIYSNLERVLKTKFNPDDRKYLKGIIDEARKEIPKVNVMTENKGLTKDEQVKQGLEEILEAKKREADNKLQKEREKANERIKNARDKGKAKLDEFKNLKKTMIDFLKMDLGDLPVSSFTRGEFQKVLTQIDKANTDYTLNQAIDQAYNVFADAAKRQRVAEARTLVKRAKTNVKQGKIGVLEPNSLIDQMLRINPKFIPNNIFDFYNSLISELGARKTVLSLSEKGEMNKSVKMVLDAFDLQNNRVEELKDIYDNYDNKGKTFADTINNMLKDDAITSEEAELMKLYKNEIEPTEVVEPKPKDIEQAIDDAVDAIKSINPIGEYYIDERKVINTFKSITRNDLKELSYKEIVNVTNIIQNINAGRIPHLAHNLRTKINGIKKGKKISPVLFKYKKTWLDWISSVKAGIKNLAGADTTTLEEQIKRNPTFNIDIALNNFKTTEVYDTVIRTLSVPHDSFDTDVNTFIETTRGVVNKLSKDGMKHFESRAKMMMYAIQKQYESNPEQAGLSTAKEYLEATIKAGNNSVYKRRNLNRLQEMFNQYKKADGELDINKLWDSFSKEEKEAYDAVNKLNTESLKPKAMITSTLIRGNRVPIYENHIHLPRATRGKQKENEIQNLQYNLNKASTRAGTLIERTGTAQPILFDYFYNSVEGAKKTLLDYHMTPAIQEVKAILNQLYKMSETDSDYETIRALESALDTSMENIYGVHMHSTTIGDKIMKEILKKGYQAQLSGVARSISEFASNSVFAVTYKPFETKLGMDVVGKEGNIKLSKAIANMPSSQSSRLYLATGLYSKNIDFSRMNIKEISKNTGYDENILRKILKSIGDNKYYELVDQLQSSVLSRPDQMIARPMFWGEFENQFEKLTGKKPDYDKIAEGDQEYLDKYNEEITNATAIADRTMIEAVASSNPWEGIIRNQDRPTKNWLIGYLNMYNTFMTRFPTFEHNSAVRAISSLSGNGVITPKEATQLLSALSLRMMTYTGLVSTFSYFMYKLILSTLSDVTGWFDYEEPEEEKKDTFGNDMAQSALTTFITLAIHRNIGNIAKIPVNYAIERLNQEYGEGITYSGKYDGFDNSLVYPLIPIDLEIGQKPIWQSAIENSAGPLSPHVKSAFRTGTALYYARNAAKPETRDKYKNELWFRSTFEAMGSMGYIPYYKDFRKMAMEVMYNNAAQAEKVSNSLERPFKIDYSKYK
jgi:hypothetical protein